jgi:putative PEP-CTERM system TPR-repeat lipoprotein
VGASAFASVQEHVMFRQSLITRRILPLTLILALGLAAASCSKDPEKAKKEYLESGNAYYAQQKYKEAAVEYRNAIQQDPKFGIARYKLAETYAKLDDPRRAYREYIRAADLMPDDADVNLKAGTLLLLAGQYEDAKSRAEKVIAKQPKHVQAQVLRANAMAGLKDVDGAIHEIEEAIELDPKQAGVYSNLGALQLIKGKREEAEAAFRKAVETDPNNVTAQLALGNFLWASGRVQEAETSFKRATAIDPKNVLANRALAAFYMGSNRVAEAEAPLKAVSENGGASAKLALADYYLGTNRQKDAAPLLQTLANDPQYFSQAKSRIAALQFLENKRPEAHATIDEVLKKQPNNPQALLVKARFFIMEKKIDDGLAKAKAAVTADPGLAAGHYLLGTIYESRQDLDEAIKSFQEVLKINPRAVPAQLQLAQLELRRGGTGSSVQLASDAVKNDPGNPVARLTLVRSLLAQNDLPRAEVELKELLTKYPNVASVQVQAGVLAVQKRDAVGARKAFEAAAAADPNSVEALAGLVMVDLGTKQPAAALARVQAQAQRMPNSAPVQVLLARTYAANRDAEHAEQALRKAIELDSSNLQAYGLLGQLYVAQKKLDQAITEFQQITTKQPKNVAAHTMIGMILQGQGKTADAQKKYEQVLQIDSRAAVAANNLAWIYAESGNNLDQALQLAQTAKAVLPDQPEVNDTLGFVYIKKDLADLAVPPLKASVEKDPQNPVYHYRLGVAYSKTGDKAAAKRELEAALKINQTFPGADDAKKILGSLTS